ncbi:acyltransferase domain-containing protein [Streptomyces kunmingensis]|uniref:Acyltransferase domain-containing protein n=1 Tax=Streptomyces kunmingensis TaxID=68225 RepID=A0ABU6C3F9_9ACTN|nr:beta-ketoacyl synthase N-terminal-like domain-containing protein [Streptomyces kunmingensis]MEB3959157.1 acyltransferase domain-containing protein [Streptomyces kunmingensis]
MSAAQHVREESEGTGTSTAQGVREESEGTGTSAAQGVGEESEGVGTSAAQRVREVLVERLGEWYGVPRDEVTDDRPLAELGLTSRDAVALTALLGEVTGRRLPATLLWETPTPGALVAALTTTGEDSLPAPINSLTAKGSCAVAVIGIGCRFPGGADSPAAYWQLLTEGRDAVGKVPQGRWEQFVPPGSVLPADLSRHGAFLDGLADFDAEFFGIAADEAVALDPQQRLLLEVVREALDHAALPAPSLAGTRTGVFVGISGTEYAHLTAARPEAVTPWTAPGGALSIAAGRLSYTFDLRGPSLAVDTACSSSLVAVDHAVRSLADGTSDVALAAGVNVLLSPAVTLGFQRAGALAADGRCKAFDAAADGMVRGEGCGVVVLKRLTDAERDGDRVLAVVTGTAVNSDGRSNGLTAPNASAQRALLSQVHNTGGQLLDYVEAHGTGTPLGDPVEAGALGAVLGRGRVPEQPLLIGSAKTNLGHLEAAAGIAGLIKTVLALHHDELPPQLHFTEPSPHVDLDALGLRVVTDPEPWPRYSGAATAGVSAFGFGGTNAHVALTEYRTPVPTPPVLTPPAPTPPVPTPPVPTLPTVGTTQPSVILLDAPTDARLRAQAGTLAHWLDSPAGRRVHLADLARTSAGRTGRGRRRAAVVSRDLTSATTALHRLAAGAPDAHLVTADRAPLTTGAPGPVWVFSGYGSQWPGMGRELLATEPVFAATVDRLEPVLREHAGISLRAATEPGADLSSLTVVMPVLYGLQVALAELCRSYGVEPSAVIGHSLGEIAAAVATGALDPSTGARIVAVRSRLLATLSGGMMAVVDLPAAEITVLARQLRSLNVAVHASPAQCVVTGSTADVEALVARVTADGGFARAMPVTAAGHSPDVEPLLEEFAWELGAVRHAQPGCRRYSTVLDDPRAGDPYDTEYWLANVRRPVRFEQAVRAAAEDGHRVFVEVAPHATQLHPLTRTLEEAGADRPLILPTLRRGTDDALTFRSSLASLLVHGVRMPAARETLHRGGRIVDIPSPPWQHRRFWVGETPEAPPLEAAPATVATTPLDRLRAVVAGVMGFGPDRLDPDVPLTDLGLDSLTAVRIRTAVEEEFGVALEPGVLLRQGTLRGVARLVDGAGGAAGLTGAGGAGGAGGASGSSGARGAGGASDIPAPARPSLPHPAQPSSGTPGVLRSFPGDGPHTPLFLAHAAGGSSDVYGRLAAQFDGSRPVFGFDRIERPDNVPGRAAEFAHRIRRLRPEGPWVLGGWSYGGLVAQEAARLLTPHGKVAALVLIDSVLPLPAPPADSPAAEARRRFTDFATYIRTTYGAELPLPYEELGGMDDSAQIDLVVKLLEQAVDLPTAVLAHQRTSYLDLRSGERHTPGPYDGRTLLYRATRPAPHTVRDLRYERTDAALGWDAHCTDLTVTPLPGHHLALLDPPVVDVLTDELTRALAPN